MALVEYYLTEEELSSASYLKTLSSPTEDVRELHCAAAQRSEASEAASGVFSKPEKPHGNTKGIATEGPQPGFN